MKFHLYSRKVTAVKCPMKQYLAFFYDWFSSTKLTLQQDKDTLQCVLKKYVRVNPMNTSG